VARKLVCHAVARRRMKKSLNGITEKYEFNLSYEKVNWDGIILDVNERFDAIRQCWRESEKRAPKGTHEKLVKDLYFPCLKLLGEFITSMEIS
jgi:hypothetical protein